MLTLFGIFLLGASLGAFIIKAIKENSFDVGILLTIIYICLTLNYIAGE